MNLKMKLDAMDEADPNFILVIRQFEAASTELKKFQEDFKREGEEILKLAIEPLVKIRCCTNDQVLASFKQSIHGFTLLAD